MRPSVEKIETEAPIREFTEIMVFVGIVYIVYFLDTYILTNIHPYRQTNILFHFIIEMTNIDTDEHVCIFQFCS